MNLKKNLKQHMDNVKLDLDWFENHLLKDILPIWLEKSVTNEGLFLTYFNNKWEKINKNFGTLVSQSRLLYNFAKGYELTGQKEYLQAVENGAYFLIEKFRDREFGGYFYSCDLHGKVVDARKDSYGHAFVIFGLAHACRVIGNPDLKQAALDAWKVMKTRFFDEYGGLYVRFSRNFQKHEGVKSQNPIMHIFEALLALADLDGLHFILHDAKTVADFVLAKLARKEDHVLPEFYNDSWSELPEEKTGQIDIGHQFEWAYLLSTAVEKDLPGEYLNYAKDFIKNGLRLGYDKRLGGIFSPVMLGGRIKRVKGWWEQCEAIRAMMHFAVLRNQDEIIEPLLKSIEFTENYMIDKENGGWYTFLGPGYNPLEQDKGFPGKVYYHVVGMCMEAIRLKRFGIDRKIEAFD